MKLKLEKVKIAIGIAIFLALIYPVSAKTYIELRNVTTEPTEGFCPLTIDITGVICNHGTFDAICVLVLTIDSKYGDSYSPITIEPGTCVFFSLSYTFVEEGDYDLGIAVICNGKLQDYYNTTITVLELDEDHDGWDDYVEQLIHKYYPEFDPVNETPTKDDVIQAIFGALPPEPHIPELPEEVKEEIKAIIKEYLEETKKS